MSPLYHPSLGGLGRQAMVLSEYLADRGVPIQIIAREMSDLPPCEYSPRVPVFRTPSYRPDIHNLERKTWLNLKISFSFCWHCARLLISKRKEYDLVHFHGASLPLFFNILLLILLRKKILAKVAAANLGTEAGSLKGRYFGVSSLLAGLARLVHRFVATSGEIEQGLLRDGIESGRIVRTPNFVDQERFRPADPGHRQNIRNQLGLGNARIVTFSGRLVARKGLPVLLEAWQALAPDFPEAMLLILGDGPERAELEARVVTLGLESRVRFEGFVQAMPDYLAATHLFVFPSFQEGQPNAVLEAMACGLPVVATRIGGVEDVIESGENGLLVEPGDARGLAMAMRKVLSCKKTALALGMRAYNRICENHTLERIAESYLDLYEQVRHNGDQPPCP